MPSASIHVYNIAPTTTENDLSCFFSFCGKITSVSVSPASNSSNSALSATISFERESAAKTAVLLDGTPLKESPLSVKAAHNIDDLVGPHLGHGGEGSGDHVGSDDGEIPQEHKTRATIFAEYLASGYVLGDAVLERGIEWDKKHGLTAKFASYLNSALQAVDNTTHAYDKARSMDTQYNLTEKAISAKSSLARYFEKALGTAPGHKLRQFYETSEKQVLDIHNEAKRLADSQLQKKRQSQEDMGASTVENLDGHPFVASDTTTCACAGSSSSCVCPPNKCVCEGCDMTDVSEKNEAANKASATGQVEHALQDIKSTAQDIPLAKV